MVLGTAPRALPQALPALVPHLAAGAWVYVEAPEAPAVPAGWREHRRMRTRETWHWTVGPPPPPPPAIFKGMPVIE